MTQHLILLAIKEKIACFRLHQLSWKSEKIEGESWTSNGINYALDRLHERLESHVEFEKVEFQFIYDTHNFANLPQVVEKFDKLNCKKLQVLRWELVEQKLMVSGKAITFSDDTKTIECNVCPLIESIFHYQNEAFETERQRALLEHETNIETIRQESFKLVQEKIALQAQVDALKRPEVEYLISFMPLIYENFFIFVSPQDLALMAGSLKIPDVASTFTEPDFETLQMLKKKLFNLPESTREQIIHFAKEIPHKSLKIRKMMQPVLNSE
jgi:hypothetical protein